METGLNILIYRTLKKALCKLLAGTLRDRRSSTPTYGYRLVVCASLILALSIGPMAYPRQALAQGGTQLLRDTETERLLYDMATPIFTAAGVSPKAVRIGIIQDNTLNAFVTQGLNMFFHTGLLLEAGSAEEVIGVMAHETGHIAGGHLIRLRGTVQSASTQAILTTLLGIAAAIGTGRGDIGAAVISGGQEIANRSILSFSRAQEASADAAGMSFLTASGQSAHGFLRFMERLGEQDLLPANRQVEYARTHPLTRNRVQAIRAYVSQHGTEEIKVSPEMAERFARMQAKLRAYLFPRIAFQRFPASDQSVTAQYARAVALWRTDDISGALKALDRLIAEEPENPYFHELMGQIYFESGKIDEAVTAYAEAADMLPDAALLQTSYAQALIAKNDKPSLELARDRLQLAVRQEPNSPFSHRLLARAYGGLGLEGPARLHLAEEAVLKRDLKVARANLERAKDAIPVDDGPNRIRLNDLENQIDELEADSDE